MDITAVYKLTDGDLQRVREVLSEALSSDVSLLNLINGKVLSSSGKYLRPCLSVLAGRLISGQDANADGVKYAAASELIHNATLLHDDVADASPVRRGKPTVFSLFGPAAAVLTGDYWLVKAMETILSAKGYTERVIRLFAHTLSMLSEGELLQMEKSESLDTTFDDYLRIIECKTASLFQAAVVSGAIAAGASEAEIDALKRYALYLGYAFQMKDDIFDYSPDSNIGKEVGVDIREGKITLPLLAALDCDCPQEKQALIDAIKAEKFDAVFAYVAVNEGVAKAELILKEYVAKAKEALASFPESQAKEALVFLADYTADRKI